MPQTELLREDEVSSGVGANIFFRKKRPGPTIGDGYIVEIYENGVKVDEKEAKGKKEIKELIDAYKSKYNTLRSFQNEVLTHVTYKTKEERGEDLTPPAEQEQTMREEKENNQQERGEIAMQAVDQILIKKAGQIHGLLQRLINPGTPLKKRADASEVGDVSFLPETPEIPGMESAELTEETIATEIAKKIVEYFNTKVTESPKEGTDKETSAAPVVAPAIAPPASAQAPAAVPPPITASYDKERIKVSYEIDDLYNDIKGWLTKVKKILKNSEKTTGKKFDKAKIIGAVKTTVTSGDPAKIQEATGITVTNEVAEVMRDIMIKPTGSPKPGQVTQQLGKETEMAGGTLTDSIDKAAATIEDKIVKVIGLTNSGKDSDAHELLKETGVQELDEFKGLPNTMGGNVINNMIKEIIQEAEGNGAKNDSGEDVAIIEICASDFWNYAGNLNRVASVDRIFEEWINKKGMSLNNALIVWSKIQDDINEAFARKKVSVERDLGGKAIFVILVTSKQDTDISINLCTLNGYIDIYPGYKVISLEVITGNRSFSAEFKDNLRKHLRKIKIQNKVSDNILNNIISSVSEYINNLNRELTSLLRYFISNKESYVTIELFDSNENQVLTKSYGTKDLPTTPVEILKKREEQEVEQEQE